MLKKCICLTGAVYMVMMLTGLPVRGANQTGSIQVIPVWCEDTLAGGQISLSKVGTRTKNGYRITDGLANWTISEEEIHSDSTINWLTVQPEGGIQLMSVDPEKGALFSDLEEGLYLVSQEFAAPGFQAMKPVVLELPKEDNWEIIHRFRAERSGESPRTGDHPAPIIGAMGLGFSAAVLIVLADQRRK